MGLMRKLDVIEEHLAGHSITLAVKYTGSINIKALKESYEQLCRKNPILLARIRHEEESGSHSFVVPNSPVPNMATYSGGRDTLMEEVNSEWLPHEVLARLVHVEGNREGFIALRVDHSIADASALSAFLRECLDTYAKRANGEDAEMLGESRSVLPIAPSELLRSRWRTANIRYPSSPSSGVVGKPELMDVIENRLRLTEKETTRLIEQTRNRGTTVNSAVSGAILLALKNMSQNDEEEEISCRTVIDLRRHVNPQVGSTETTNFVGWHTSTILLGSKDSVFDVGERVRISLLDAVRSGSIFLSEVAAVPKLSSRAPEKRLAMTSITNAGVLYREDSVGGIEVEDMFGARPQRIAKAFFSRYAVHTLVGCLRVIGTFPRNQFNETETKQVIESIHEYLTAF